MKKVFFFTVFFCLCSVFFLNFSRKSIGACLSPGSPSEEFQKASRVFSGKVIRVEETEVEDAKVTFQVLQSWKGKPARQISVFDVDSEHNNDIKFVVGQEYLVYAHGYEFDRYTGSKKEYKGKVLAANRCTHTALLSDSESNLKMLGPGKKVK